MTTDFLYPVHPGVKAALTLYRVELAAVRAEQQGKLGDTIVNFAAEDVNSGVNITAKKKKIVAARLRPHRALASNLANRMIQETCEMLAVYVGDTDGIPADRQTLHRFRINNALKEMSERPDPGITFKPGVDDRGSICMHTNAAQLAACEIMNDIYTDVFKAPPKELNVNGVRTFSMRNDLYPASVGLCWAQTRSTSIYYTIINEALGLPNVESKEALNGLMVAPPVVHDLVEMLYAAPTPGGSRKTH